MWTLSGFADEISPDFEKQCQTLRTLDVKYLEFRSAWDTNALDLNDAQLRLACRILAAHDLRVSSVGSPIGKIGIHDNFDEHLYRFDRALKIAALLEAPYIRIFSFFLPGSEPPDLHREEVLRRLRALTARACGHDVVLLHENEKRVYGDTPERCRDIVESVGSPQLRLTWDAANFVQCHVRPHTEAYALLRPYVDYVQIKDAIWATGQVVPAGGGDGEVRETVQALYADGFDGFFSLEPHLAASGAMSGFSGAELFTTAHHAFARLLADEHIDYQ
jgi:sugar phosphate isomerase/epimerase